jgi:hypothetical protein
MGEHTPNTCEPSKSHTSDDYPYRHVDEYAYGKNGERDKDHDTHGISLSGTIMDAIDSFLGFGKK